MTLSGLLSAIRTLTIIPIPGSETEKPYQALPWFVLVGAGLGLFHYSAAVAILYFSPGFKPLVGIFLVAGNYLLSGGMHLDGLADSADALGTPHSSEKTLAILKDPHIGSFGTIALCLTVMWRILVYQQLSAHNGLLWLVFALTISRILQGLLLQIFPYARGSEGKAFGYKGPIGVLILLLVQIGGIETVAWFVYGTPVALVPFVCGIAAILPVIYLYMKRIGGLTGDGIGAATELFEIAFLTGVTACLF